MTARPSFVGRFTELYERVTAGPGELAASVRHAAASGGPVPADASAYTDKVRRHAYKVVDRDVEELIAAGWSENEIFELTVAIAMGEGMTRLERARRALQEAKD